MVLFKKGTIVSNFFFKLLDCEKFLHNCNRQNIHVAETTCTPASAIFFFLIFLFVLVACLRIRLYILKRCTVNSTFY